MPHLARAGLTDVDQPLHMQVYRAIARDVADGRLRAEDRIPSERTLAERLGVSRDTIRRALGDLTDNGLLVRRDRRGWFVSATTISPEPQLHSLTAWAAEQGLTCSSKVLVARTRPATLDESQALASDLSAPVFELERLRLLAGAPVAIDRTSVLLERAPGIEDVDYETASLFSTLREQCDVVLTRAEYTVSAIAATDRQAKHLELSRGAPLLHAHGTVYDQHHRPIYVGDFANRGDRFRLRTVLLNRMAGGDAV